MTPIAEIAELKIGSRPASRTKSDRDRGSARHPLGVQLGAGAGDAARLVRRRRRRSPAFGDQALLREMREAWPFFRTTLDNLEMVLAKSDMGIAARYAALVEDRALRDAIFDRIRDGWQRTHDCLLAITGQSRLLEKQSRARRLDPPAPALYRAAQPAPDRTAQAPPRRRRPIRASREGIQLSINAIATALRNSGLTEVLPCFCRGGGAHETHGGRGVAKRTNFWKGKRRLSRRPSTSTAVLVPLPSEKPRGGCGTQTTPKASIASATFLKPAMLAPFT